MENKRAQVIMLPTEKSKGVIEKCIKLPYESYGTLGMIGLPHPMKEDLNWESQHLYFTTDEEIKEGDWCIKTSNNHIIQNLYGCTGSVLGNKQFLKDRFKKIIATNDTKLKVISTCCEGTGYDKRSRCRICDGTGTQSLPQPSQAFIEKYCKVGGIENVLVEYENNVIDSIFNKHINEYENTIESQLKVNSHNEITIHPIKDSWTKEELKKIAVDYAYFVGTELDPAVHIDKWINKNL